MTYKIEKEISDICLIYKTIFLSNFPEEEYKSKIEKGYETLPIKIFQDNKLVGFCIIIDKKVNSTLHCWIGGVVPEYRNKKVFSSFIGWAIEYAEKNGYRRITLNTDNYKPDIIRIMVKYGFDIIEIENTKYGDGKKIKFVFNIFPASKMRLSITDKCNMNCFFCHTEGNFTSSIGNMELSAIEQLMIQACKLNYKEVTITGGEPLLYFEGVKTVLDNCKRWINPPKIKICTNGTLLDENKLELFSKYKGELELNISIHSVDSDQILAMTGVKFNINKTKYIFMLLNRYQIKYRVNTVILKGVNDNEKSILDLLSFAFDNQIKSVHFLELLVTKQQKDLTGYYINIDEIEKKIKLLCHSFEINTIEKNSKKTSLMISKNEKNISVVLYRLSCRCGCDNCYKENDVKIGADMCLHPCYIDNKANCGNAVQNLKEVMKNREAFLISKESSYSNELLYWGE